VAPVLTAAEAPGHAHNTARGTFADIEGITQPAPAPRFGRTAAGTPAPPRKPGQDTDAVLADLGTAPAEIATLRASGTIG
jgi:alpha-methylacyl-CoA racemase